jgi:hypothetical protein
MKDSLFLCLWKVSLEALFEYLHGLIIIVCKSYPLKVARSVFQNGCRGPVHLRNLDNGIENVFRAEFLRVTKDARGDGRDRYRPTAILFGLHYNRMNALIQGLPILSKKFL